ncbi:MAG TPA: hypothetical protein PKB14_09435 [Rubrivivax sp.]|nr:hypothetical protein [Rubrivivax sp.]
MKTPDTPHQAGVRVINNLRGSNQANVLAQPSQSLATGSAS